MVENGDGKPYGDLRRYLLGNMPTKIEGPVCYAKVQLKVLSQSWQIILKEQIICHQKPYSTKMQHYTKN